MFFRKYVLAQERIFEKTWLFIAHESMMPKDYDYFTTTMGQVPIVVIRTPQGFKAFINACAHRGAKLYRTTFGHAKTISCGFHGWTFDAHGHLLGMPKEEESGYPDFFQKSACHLTPVAKIEEYRGFIFATLNGDAPSLADHLGDTRRLIDLLVDKAPHGLEVVTGFSRYTFKGNWKMQAENGVDGWHVGATHLSYVLTIKNRAAQEDTIRPMDVSGLGMGESGFFAFPQGHCLLWGDWPNPENSPDFAHHESYKAQFGETRAKWMLRQRNLLIYPNVFLMDQMSTQIRVFRPLAVDKTEVTIYCIAPKGEDRQARDHRLRQYEDFFNASGMATADDLAEFEYCMDGYQAAKFAPFNDSARGFKHLSHGPDARAKELGIAPSLCGGKLEDEAIFLAQHQAWLKLMEEAAQ